MLCKSVIADNTLDQWSNVVIQFVNQDVVSFCNQSFQIFAEEIREHQNLDYANEYKQIYQFGETTVTKCACLILSKKSLWLILSVSSNCFISSSCSDLTYDSTQVVLGLGCGLGMTLGGMLSKTISGDTDTFFTSI